MNPKAASSMGGLAFFVGHREWIADDTPLEKVLNRFAENGRDFMAVLRDGRLLGVCARRQVAMLLGARYGFALHARTPVREQLIDGVLSFKVSTGLTDTLTQVSARANERFYDDVLLTDDAGGFIGFIFVHELVRLQTKLMLGNIEDLERSRQEIADKNKLMEEDLLMAREVQQAMLAQGSSVRAAARWSVASRYAPAGGVSGDFFQVIPISDDSAAVLVCDVMGHGVRSALVTAMLCAFVDGLRPEAHDPGVVLTRLNQNLMGVLRQAGTLLFVTAAYVVVDAAAQTLRYGQAGHPTGLIRRASGAVESLPADGDVAGPALGLIENHPYVFGCTALARGDGVFLFTDGLTEARDATGEEWGEERMRAAVEAGAHLEAQALIDALVAQARGFAGRAFDDDLCLVSLGVQG